MSGNKMKLKVVRIFDKAKLNKELKNQILQCHSRCEFMFDFGIGPHCVTSSLLIRGHYFFLSLIKNLFLPFYRVGEQPAWTVRSLTRLNGAAMLTKKSAWNGSYCRPSKVHFFSEDKVKKI